MLPPFVSILWLSAIFHLGMISLIRPPTPIAPPATAENHDQEKPEIYGLNTPKFGKAKLGPTVGVGIPRGIQVGLESKWKNRFGLGVAYAWIPERAFHSTKIGLNSIEIKPRYYPFEQGFFLSLALGKQDLHVQRTQTISDIAVGLDAIVDTLYLEPQIGWHWEAKSGFFWGFELGWQMALSAETHLQTSGVDPLIEATPQYSEQKASIEDAGNQIGKTALPVALFKLGWFF